MFTMMYVLLSSHHVSMLTDNKSHDMAKTKPRQARCRTNLPPDRGGLCMFKKFSDLPLMREGLCI